MEFSLKDLVLGQKFEVGFEEDLEDLEGLERLVGLELE